MFSNHFIWKINRVKNVLQIFYPFIILFLIGYIAYLKRPEKPIMEIAPVLVIENGRATRLACDTKDQGYKDIAIKKAIDLAQIIYSISSEKSDSSKAALFGENFENNTQSAQLYHKLILNNFKTSQSGELAEFHLDESSIQAGSDSEDRFIYSVILSGDQIIKKTASQTTKKVTMSVVYKFNLNRGKDGKIFSIQKFNPEFKF